MMTGRRRSYLEHWAPLHNMTVEEATANFPKEAGIARYGEPEDAWAGKIRANLFNATSAALFHQKRAPHPRRSGGQNRKGGPKAALSI
jgi:hypothetical protein